MAGLHPACGDGCAVADSGDRMADSLSYEEQFCLAQKMPYRLWLVYTGREPAATGVEWEQARRSAMVAYPWPYLPPDIYADQAEPKPDITAAIRDVARGGDR